MINIKKVTKMTRKKKFISDVFPYQKAAEYGDVVSMLILARIFSGTTPDVLPDVPLENPPRPSKSSFFFFFLLLFIIVNLFSDND